LNCGCGFWSKVPENSAEVEFGRVHGLNRDRLPVRAKLDAGCGETFSLGGFLGCSKSLDKFSHKVRETECGQEEDNEGLLGYAGCGSCRGAIWHNLSSFEGGKRCGCERGGICWRRSTSDLRY
jgi:hypothetical protein